MGMITLTGTLTALTDTDAETARRLLPEHIRLSRAEPGCLKFEITQEGDPMVWHLDEAFVDAEAFAAHQARTKASVWGREGVGLARDFVKTGG